MNLPLNINFQQLFLHLCNFVILFGVLYFLLYAPVKKFLASREEYFKNLDDEAKTNLDESEKLKAEYETKINLAEEEINAMKKKSRSEIEAARKIKLEQTQAEADKMLADARISIEREHRKMIRESKNELSDIVTNAVEKIIAEHNTSISYDRFLEEVKRGENVEQD